MIIDFHISSLLENPKFAIIIITLHIEILVKFKIAFYVSRRQSTCTAKLVLLCCFIDLLGGVSCGKKSIQIRTRCVFLKCFSSMYTNMLLFPVYSSIISMCTYTSLLYLHSIRLDIIHDSDDMRGRHYHLPDTQRSGFLIWYSCKTCMFINKTIIPWKGVGYYMYRRSLMP